MNVDEYRRLRRVAQSLLKNEAQSTLTATGLVHELLLRSSKGKPASNLNSPCDSVSSWSPYASRRMKQILVDRARRRLAKKRAENEWSERNAASDLPSQRDRAALALIELADAIELLSRESPKHAELVRLHLYDNVSIESAADRLGISRATAFRKWAFCKAWLASKIGSNR